MVKVVYLYGDLCQNQLNTEGRTLIILLTDNDILHFHSPNITDNLLLKFSHEEAKHIGTFCHVLASLLR